MDIKAPEESELPSLFIDVAKSKKFVIVLLFEFLLLVFVLLS